MKLMRGVLRPSYINLSRQFHSIRNSSARRRRVSIEIPSLAHGLCGRSYAASASSNPLEARQGRRRVSKDERRSMVENYVKKYRETNAGKFPTASAAQKDVGGSYYVVRQILQEMIYNSKMPITDTKDALLDSSVKKEKEVSAKSREVFQTKELSEPINQASKVDVEVPSSEILESKPGTKPLISVEDDKSEDVDHVHRLIDDPKSHVHPDPEKGQQEEIVHEDKLKFDHLQSKTEAEEPTEIAGRKFDKSEDVDNVHRLIDDPKSHVHLDPEKSKQEEIVHEDKLKFDHLQSKTEAEESTEIAGRKLHEEPTEDVEQRKSTIWSNLKSFADGILSRWRGS